MCSVRFCSCENKNEAHRHLKELLDKHYIYWYIFIRLSRLKTDMFELKTDRDTVTSQRTEEIQRSE